MKTRTLSITGMHCEGCARLISSLLNKLDGVQACAVSHAESSARVLYDETRLDAQALRAAIERAGYQVDTRTFDPAPTTRS